MENNNKHIEITTAIGCPNQCAYCPQKTLVNNYLQNNKSLMMSFQTFKKCIYKIPRNVEISFAGMTEPWTNKNCTKMILYTHNKGYSVSVFSSLVGITKNDIDLIKHIRFFSNYGNFVVHLPSTDKLEKINLDKKYYDNLQYTVQNIKNISFVYIGKNISRKIKQIILDKPIRQIKPQSRSNNLTSDITKNITRKKGVIFCERNLTTNILLPNGDVILCCQDYSLKHKLGNLKYDSYRSLFNSIEFKKIKKGLRDPKIDILCRYCIFAKNNPKSKYFGLINKFIK